jgi:hypothetical protein
MKKKQIVIIESAPSDTLTKIAKTLKKRNYETIFITLVGNIEADFLKESYDKVISFNSKFFKINISSIPKIFLHGIKTFPSIITALYKIQKLDPYIVIGRAPPNWLCTLFMFYFKKCPFIYLPFDIRSFSYTDKKEAISHGIPLFELASEGYCFKNCDGIIHKGGEDELKHLNKKILGDFTMSCPSLYFFPYCLNEFMVKVDKKNKLSLKDKKIHTVYVGHVPNDSGWIEGMKQIIDQKIYLHLYSRTNNIPKEDEKKRVEGFLKEFLGNKFLVLHESVSQSELAKEISKYDYGWYGYCNKSQEMYAYATGNKIPSYLEAGIPIISPSFYVAANKILKKHNVGIIIKPEEFGEIKNILKKNNTEKFSKSIIVAREELSMETQITRLEEFFRQVRKYKFS